MIETAASGGYDDFLSEHPAPITRLVCDALEHGLKDIARRAKDGEFDATADEAVAWAKSDEGRATLKEFGIEL